MGSKLYVASMRTNVEGSSDPCIDILDRVKHHIIPWYNTWIIRVIPVCIKKWSPSELNDKGIMCNSCRAEFAYTI